MPQATVGNGQYQLLPTDNYDPDDETWEFLPGFIVECESRSKSGARILVATRAT